MAEVQRLFEIAQHGFVGIHLIWKNTYFATSLEE